MSLLTQASSLPRDTALLSSGRAGDTAAETSRGGFPPWWPLTDVGGESRGRSEWDGQAEAALGRVQAGLLMAGVRAEGDRLPTPALELLLDALLRLQAHRELHGNRQGARSQHLTQPWRKALGTLFPKRAQNWSLSSPHTPRGSQLGPTRNPH